MNIFIASLPYQLEEADLRATFEEYGTVSSVKLIIDRETGKKRGFGFIEMPDDEEAQKAISELNGAEISGRAISVSKAEDKRDNSRGRSFGGRSERPSGFNRDGRSSGSFNRGGSRDREDSRNGNRW